jgi:hypothetical protein
MQLFQNAIKHPSQTGSCIGSVSINIRIDRRSAAGTGPQTAQSSSLVGRSVLTRLTLT